MPIKKSPVKSADQSEFPLAVPVKVPPGFRLPLARLPVKRTEVPGTYLKIDQPPLSAFDDNPVFDEISAGVILGISPETLKKWRQRHHGPDYIQYGRNGTVRYALNALMEFRARNTVKTKQKK
jgi:hypothetical protein